MAAHTAVLVSSYLDEKTSTNLCISTLLESITERQSLQGSGCSKQWIAKLNGFLNSNSDRWLGISLLGTTLWQCDTEVFTANCLSWMKIIQHILESPKSSLSLIQCSVKVLEDLMKYTIQFSDLMRNAANSSVPSIISALLSLKDKDVVCSLSGVCTCLKYFPGPGSTFKTKIENCVTTCLDTSDANIRNISTQCFALVAGCNSNTSDDKQRKSWEFQWSRVLGTIHATLDKLPGYDITANETKINEAIPMEMIVDEEPKKTNTCTARLRSLLQCLEAMIRQGTRKVNTIPLNDTIALLERLLAVNENTWKGSVSLDMVLLKGCLPLIHLSSVELLCSIMQRCGSLLLPVVSRISNMLVNELSWTSDVQAISASQCGSFKPYSKLRCAVYNCFLHWGQLNASCQPNVIKDVIRNILKEIKVPTNSQTKLNAPLQDLNKQKPSKGKKRKLQTLEQLSTNNKKADPLSNALVCHTALSALFGVLINCGEFVTKEIFQEVQVTLLDLVNQFQSCLPGNLPPPYSSPDCRKEVYHSLIACVLARPSGVPTAINCVIRCLKQGLQDSHYKVSIYCREALQVVTALIHPVVPSLDVAVQPMVYSTQHSTESRTSQNGSLEDDNSLYTMEGELSLQTPSVSLEGVQSSIRNSFAEKVFSGGEKDGIENRAEGHSLELRGSDDIHVGPANEEDGQQGDRTGDNNVVVDSEQTNNNIHESPGKNITDVTDYTSSFAEDKFINIESQQTVDTPVTMCDNDDDDNNENDDNDEDTAPIPSKKLKTDNQDHHTIDDQQMTADVIASSKEQDTNDTQDMGDVNEMLASFVNSSPDSDSE